ncbi:MAG: mechanosensitive ion channel [Nanoarchaeota archaeon]|nr:mechanosensitive ion channel [DPANN group archaeon]MBL7116814.1 mechanosensitive ion channel [Nanoarchaeota archaeon]
MALTDSIINISDAFVQNQLLIKIVTAIIILLIGFIIGRIVGRIILKLLKEIEFDKTIRKATGYQASFSALLSKSSSYFIYFLAILMALESLGLTPFVLNMISVVILLIVGISVILAIKDFIPNFIAGYSVRKKGLYKQGDRIKVGKVEGKITKISLLDTHVVTKKKDMIVIPNSYFIKNLVIKKSR